MTNDNNNSHVVIIICVCECECNHTDTNNDYRTRLNKKSNESYHANKHKHKDKRNKYNKEYNIKARLDKYATSNNLINSERIKTCTKCGRDMPATTEYFVASKAKYKDLLDYCLDCKKNKLKETQKKISEANREKRKEYDRKRARELKEINLRLEEKYKDGDGI